MPDRLETQLQFIAELDGLKSVLRKTSPIGQTRKENSAEHSWQVILMAICLAEYAAHPIDLLKVVKMLAIHDAVEVDVGDTFHYAKDQTPDPAEREKAAAKRLFAILPEPQATEFDNLWQEFEDKKSNDAQFAACIDRLAAFITNAGNQGGTWREFNISIEQIVEKNQEILNASPKLWEWARQQAQTHCNAQS